MSPASAFKNQETPQMHVAMPMGKKLEGSSGGYNDDRPIIHSNGWQFSYHAEVSTNCPKNDAMRWNLQLVCDVIGYDDKYMTVILLLPATAKHFFAGLFTRGHAHSTACLELLETLIICQKVHLYCGEIWAIEIGYRRYASHVILRGTEQNIDG